MKRQYVIAAVAAVAVFLLYHWWKNRSYVLDPSNSTALNDLFKQLNPTVGGQGPASADDQAQAIATGDIAPAVSPQNFMPLTQSSPSILGSFGPITSPYPRGLQVQS